MKKCNLGCSQDYREGYINVDINPVFKPDLIIDLNSFPWAAAGNPLPHNHFDEVRAFNIIEHLPNTLRVMEEIWRISKPGAKVEIMVPFYNSSTVPGDITHVKGFCFESFTHLTKQKNVHTDNKSGAEYTKCYFDIIKIKGIPTPLGKLIPNIKIKRRGITGLRDCMAHIFGEILSNIYFEMRVEK